MHEDPKAHDAIRHQPSPRCIACGSHGVELYAALTDHVAGAPGTWRIARCARAECGLLWLDPKPLAAELIKAYTTYHTHGKVAAGSSRQLALSAINSGCKLLSRLFELGSGLGRQRRQLRTMFLGTAVPGRLLEIGCGSGRFLDRMRRRGWEVQGTDFDPTVAARIRDRFDLRVDVGGDLSEFDYASSSFDAVAMSQVIEHLHDPLAQLREACRLLRPGGNLVLTTPNVLGMAHRLFGRNWRGLEPPRHLHLFTPAAIEQCVRTSGFQNIRVRTLSAESAGIYRASEELRHVPGGQRAGAAVARVVRSWWLRGREYEATRQDPHAGQDILLMATK